MMTTTGTIQTQERAIVVVVGPASTARTEAARTLIEDGSSVVLCAGPPACPLLREERCALVDVADAVVLMPPALGNHRIEAGLAMCARAAQCAVVVEGSKTVPWPAEAILVGADDLDGVAQGFRTASRV